MENFLEINYEKNMQMLEDASKFCEQDFSHEELINELYNDNDLKKQLCIIEIKEIKCQKEADILVYNLTGHSGPIREAAAYKILELIKNDQFNGYFQTKQILDVFVKAITDINPSVSRHSVEIISYVADAEYLYNCLIAEIKHTLSEMENIKQSRSYTSNKKNFNLYWNLEAITSVSQRVNAGTELFEILSVTALSNDYTIREKTAKVAKIFSEKNNSFYKVIELLKDDTNIYVKKYL